MIENVAIAPNDRVATDGNKLYLGDILIRNLTKNDELLKKAYDEQVSEYNEKLKGVNELVRKGEKAVNVPQPPLIPKYCRDYDTTEFLFDGCVVLNSKVYVNGTEKRHLSPEEVDQMRKFINDTIDFLDYQNRIYQKGSGLEAALAIAAVQQPERPKISC
ncbi:Aspartyl protease inhibitor [Toxocara canis]|uniref:Aspartyl protease inhibitor n=1 Tax=Toxocara canis TaxID=6265 RepID=A0A0B2VIR7_TOXCA|nr:Aspartyl protease inhibitor [Toxocara canis]